MPVHFRKKLVSFERFETAGVFDLNGDGKLEIVSGAYWYEKPDVSTRHVIGPVAAIDEYFDDFSTIPLDVNGDGRGDFIFNNGWLEAPADPYTGAWTLHEEFKFGSASVPIRVQDVNGDGQNELITGKRYRAHNGANPGEYDPIGIYYFKWNGDSFSKQIIDFGPTGIGKGCGLHFAVGDVSGNGRLDVVAPGKDGLYFFENLGESARA